MVGGEWKGKVAWRSGKENVSAPRPVRRDMVG